MVQQYFSNFFVNEARKNAASSTNIHEEMVIDLATRQPIYKKQYGMVTIFFENVNFTKTKEITHKNKAKSRKNLNDTARTNKNKTKRKNKHKNKNNNNNNNAVNIVFGCIITGLLLLIALILKNKNYNNQAEINGKEKLERKQKHKLN